MIIVHSALVRCLPHHLTELLAAQTEESEQLFEPYTTTSADAAPVAAGLTRRPPRPGRLTQSAPPRAARIMLLRPSQPRRLAPTEASQVRAGVRSVFGVDTVRHRRSVAELSHVARAKGLPDQPFMTLNAPRTDMERAQVCACAGARGRRCDGS